MYKIYKTILPKYYFYILDRIAAMFKWKFSKGRSLLTFLLNICLNKKFVYTLLLFRRFLVFIQWIWCKKNI